MSDDVRYFSFPIPLLRGVIAKPDSIGDCIQDIVRYALYYHALHLPYTEGGDNAMKTQIKAAADYYSVTIGDVETTLSVGRHLTDKFKNVPICSVNTDIIWNFNNNKKTRFEVEQFCAFCAIRSIIGKKEFSLTNKNLIHARMFGYASATELEKNSPNISATSIRREIMEERNAEFLARERYHKRYQMDKILNKLEISWGLKRYADHIKGMFVSFTKSLDELATLNIQHKEKTKLEVIKDLKAQAKKRAELEHLKKRKSIITAP